MLFRSIGASYCSWLFAHAVLDEILALRPDDLLVDRLLQAIDMPLRQAKLHLVLPVLALLALRGDQTFSALAAARGCARRGIGRCCPGLPLRQRGPA